MPVDPKGDIDICITCLTKTPPKLPLREELPSLGVELIYKARGMGANVSKREAKKAAKEFRYNESFKDLKKRRLFPKSSRRIRSILEERRRHESEIRNLSSAVSYESYKDELYGDWVTDSSSSSQTKHSSSSSTASSVSEIKTTRNRHMTKAALQRWRLFRKQSNRRKEKIQQKKEEERRKKERKEKKKRVSQTSVTTGSLIGADVFADFLAPLPHVDDSDDSEGSDAFVENEMPSWLPDDFRRKSDSQTSPKRSWYPDGPNRSKSPAKSSYSLKSKPSEHSSYFDDDDFPPVGLADDRPVNPFDSKSSTTPTSPASNKYPDAKSPRSAVFTPDSSQRRKTTTPTTMATSPDPAMSPEMSSVTSSVTFSQKQTRREKLLGSNSKLSRYLAHRKDRNETGVQQCIQESHSQESTSDTSLIGLSVAFPNDEPALDVPKIDAGTKSKNPQRPFFEKNVDSYVSDDSDSPDDSGSLRTGEEQSGVYDNQPSDVLPSKTFSWKDASLLGMGGVSQDYHQEPTIHTNRKNSKPAQPSSQNFDDIPEDLYQAFGREGGEGDVKKPVFATKVVIPGEEDTNEIASYHPIVPGTDIELKNKNYGGENESATVQPSTPHVGASNETTEENKKQQKQNVKFNWWNGGMQKIRNIGSKKKADAGYGPDEVFSVGLPKTDSAKEDEPSEVSGVSVVIPSNKDVDGTGVVQHKPSLKERGGSVAGGTTSRGLDTSFAFSDIPEEFYGVLFQGAGKKNVPARLAIEEEEKSLKDVLRGEQFMLTQYDTEIGVVKQMIDEDPTLVQLKDQEDGQMLLHRLSSSPFPPHIDSDGFLDLLLDDIRTFHEKLDVIFTAFPAASEVVDSHGDLPVHLLARNLMHWETTWYAKVYEQAAKESENPVPGGPATAAITTLYHTMSLCIEAVLKRVVLDERLCQERGSTGSLLPLHIATIFTASVGTLRRALEAYPVGAVECASVKGFHSFVPDGALPIEIHESFCTDFPKWEVEVSGTDEMKWSQRREIGKSSLEDSIRRSDLLFAYNPSIQRFWKDKSRIRRIECRINFEAKQAPETVRQGITKTSERLWIWMCTFVEAKGRRAVFAKSVERILEDLPLSLVRMLATIPATSGEAILDIAHPDCVAVIRDRLDCLSDSITPIPTKSESNSKILQSWDETLCSKFSQAGKINLGQVCRAIFNIKETEIPTSFVILPYKLARNANGTLGMSSAESAPVAVQFAECLLKLTDPRSILYFLDKKSESYFGVSMYEGADDAPAREKAFTHVVEFEKALIDLYASRVGYLYLLDEETGVPLVPETDEVYPMILHEPVSMVRKLLPMMIMGMVQMRGEKAVSVASATLLDSSIEVVPSHYEHAAKKMNIFLHWAPSFREQPTEESTFIKSELNRFLASFGHKRQRDEDTLTGTTEWNVELSIIRMLFEVNDPKGWFAGLKKEEVTDEEIRWIFDENFDAHTRPPVVIIQAKQVRNKNGNDTMSESSDQSPTDSYATFGADPLKFHQPPDDATETTYDTQATQPFMTDDAAARGGAYIGLAPTESDDSTESERLRSKNTLLMDTFGAKAISYSNLKGDEQRPARNPAEQVWVDVNNRLDVTGFFWDEAQVTNLRVDLLRQANKLCSLQKRIVDIKQEENEHARRVQELFCQIMGDNCNVLEVPSPRSLFGARKLLARLNELETRLMESEVGAQHLSFGVATLNEEIVDLVPLLEEESSFESETSSHDIQSCISESDDSAMSGIMSEEDPTCSSSKIVSDASDAPTETQMKDTANDSKVPPKSWASTSPRSIERSIERIRKAFAAARRGEISLQAARHSIASHRSVTTAPAAEQQPSAEQTSSVQESTSKAEEDHTTKLSTLTDSRSSALREKAAAARSRAAAQAAPLFPVEIALPTLDHRAASSSNSSSGGNNNNNSDELVRASKSSDTSDTNSNKKNGLESEGSSSFSFENTSTVQYDKETGRIAF